MFSVLYWQRSTSKIVEIAKFHEVLDGLTRQQRRVLDQLLGGAKDQHIADSLQIDRTTVRKHIEAICKAFGLKNPPGERYSKRLELISLFCRYKPELVQQNVSPDATGTTGNLDTSLKPEDPENCLSQDNPSLQHDLVPLPPKGGFVAYDSAWVGREGLIAHLSNRLQETCRLLLLAGITGIGKTALAERLCLDLRNWFHHDQKRLCRKNFDHTLMSSDFVSVAAKWLEDSGGHVSSEERTKPLLLLHRLVAYFCSYKQLVLIDSLELLLLGNEETGWSVFVDEWWCQFFESLLSAENCESRFIITSQELPEQLVEAGSRYANFWHCQHIEGLTEAEQVTLFHRTVLDMTRQSPARELLLRTGKAYKGHPLALRTIAGEIVNDFASNVSAYWQQYGHEIEDVEKALEEAGRGAVTAAKDEWKLDRYSVALRRKVKSRLDRTFRRLAENAHQAYILLCTASVYRCPVQKSWWLRHLEYRGCTGEQQILALQALQDRFLVEVTFDQDNVSILVGQHNLVRSIAITHREKLSTQQ